MFAFFQNIDEAGQTSGAFSDSMPSPTMLLANDGQTAKLVAQLQGGPAKSEPQSDLDKLTPREREILSCLARGESNKAIARELDVAESTVKNRLSVLFEKIGVLDRTQAAIYAITHGIAPTAVQSSR